MTKSINRKFRKILKAAGKKFPLQGNFTPVVSGTPIYDPKELPNNLNRCKVEYIVGGKVITPPKPKATPKPQPQNTTTLYKKIVREADPTKPNSKRRTDYREVKNPKPDTTYYVKINGKWQPVDNNYAEAA